jgi:flagellar motor switch protein FliG
MDVASEGEVKMKRVSEAVKKAGTLLHALGPEASKEILSYLNPEEAEQLTSVLVHVANSKINTRMQVAAEFKTRMMRSQIAVGDSTDSVDHSFLKYCSLDHLSKVLKNENPQLLALVAFYLGEKRCQAFLDWFPKSKQIMIRERISTLKPVSDQVLHVLEETILEKLSLEKMNQLNTQERSAFLARLVGRSVSPKDNLLQTLEQEHPQTFKQLQSVVTPFEDLKDITHEKLTSALEKISDQDLVCALKIASLEIKDKFFECLPEARCNQVQRQLAQQGALSLKQIEQAQQKIMNAIFESQGEFHVPSH